MNIIPLFGKGLSFLKPRANIYKVRHKTDDRLIINVLIKSEPIKRMMDHPERERCACHRELHVCHLSHRS